MAFTVNLLLHCSSEDRRRSNVLEFRKQPQTVAQVKARIQEELHIPTCCQEVRFETALLRDGEVLHSYRIRNGDSLEVWYSSEADVEELATIIASMKRMIAFVQSIQAELSQNISTAHLLARINQGISVEKVQALVEKYFYCKPLVRSKANKLFFAHNDGIGSLHKLHLQLLEQPWCNTPLEMQHLEKFILLAFSDLTIDPEFRSLVVRFPVLEATIKSFLRVPIPSNANVTAPHNNYTNGIEQHLLNIVVSEVIFHAMGTICKVKEHSPVSRMMIVRNQRVIEQLLASMHSPTYTYFASLTSIATFVGISSFESDTHPYLSDPKVINGVCSACDKHSQNAHTSDDDGAKECLLLYYFSAFFFAQLTIGSAQAIPLEYKLKMYEFLKYFTNLASYSEISEHNFKHGFQITTSIPFSRLPYYPYLNPAWSCTAASYSSEENRKMRDLESVCIEFGVLSLHAMLCSIFSRDMLVQEDMVDYIVCLPWNITKPEKAREDARELVSFLRQKLQLQPPPLLTMVKAKLAAMHFGLERVLRAQSVHELLAELYPL